MLTQREVVSLRTKIESLNAQIAYAHQRITYINWQIREEDKRHNELLTQETTQLNQTTNEIETQNIRARFEPLHEAFIQQFLEKEREKKTLAEEIESNKTELQRIERLLS